MPVYNCELYISKTIESILEQSFSDFELIIINDCSTDATLDKMSNYKDDRILIMNNDKNIGLYRSVNIGFKHSSGRYIARIDSDDIALPNRFQEQFEHLDSHPGIGLVGSNYYEIDENDQICSNIIKFPTDPIVIKWRLCFENPIPSPVMFRRELFIKVGGYDERSRFAMDYDLFTKISHCSKLSNIPKVLMHWRVHPKSISSKNKFEQLDNAMNSCQRYVSEIINKPVSSEVIFNLWHREILNYGRILNVTEILLIVYKSIINENKWNKDEIIILKKHVTNKLLNYLKPHIKQFGSLVIIFKLILLCPFVFKNKLNKIVLKINLSGLSIEQKNSNSL